jgi:hypothetical protein
VGGGPAQAYLAKARGLRATERGEIREAVEILRNSAAARREPGRKRELAQSCDDWARAETRAGTTNRARGGLDEAVELFRAREALPELERARSLRASLAVALDH